MAAPGIGLITLTKLFVYHQFWEKCITNLWSVGLSSSKEMQILETLAPAGIWY